MTRRSTAAGFAALATAFLTVLAPVASAKYLRHADSVHLEAMRQQAGKAPVATWTHNYRYGGVAYSWRMVGTDPAAGSATTTVPVYIVPVVFKFPNGYVLDPTKSGQKYRFTPLQLTLRSPVFKRFSFTAGGVYLGTTQYADAFQRANFWNTVSGIAPDYHVLLAPPTVLPPLVYKVGSNKALSDGPNGVKIGTVSDNGVDNAALAYMRQHPQITPNSFAIFLTYNVSTTNACGYHSNVGSQTYTVTMFDDNQVCGTVDGDVDTLTHEVAEWVDDPFGDNTTPDKTQALEVGDPVSDYGFYLRTPSFKYTLQDLVFSGWFTCAVNAKSVNGWFDYMHKFKKNDC